MHPELYRPPSTYLSDRYGNQPATPRQRIYAAFIDWGLFMFAAGLPYGIGQMLSTDALGNGFIISLLVFGAAQFGCLRSGQTLGKRRLKIRVVGEDGERVSALRLAVLRWGLFWVIPIIGILSSIGALLPEGRALHDVVAKTKVVVV